MCGKFTQMMSWQGVHDLSDLIGQPAGGAEDYTTPMRFADVIRLDASGKRETARMRWGFAELRSKTPLDKPGHMHARGETIDELPTFRAAFERARGIVLTKTFNIGEDLPNGRMRHRPPVARGDLGALDQPRDRVADVRHGDGAGEHAPLVRDRQDAVRASTGAMGEVAGRGTSEPCRDEGHAHTVRWRLEFCPATVFRKQPEQDAQGGRADALLMEPARLPRRSQRR